MVSDGGEVVIVDLHFREQFAMALPTGRYRAALSITEKFVGSTDRLKALVDFLCKEMAAAFSLRGLTLPPWRRKLAVLSKWLPARARTVRVLPGLSATPPTAAAGAQPPATSAALGARDGRQATSTCAEQSAQQQAEAGAQRMHWKAQSVHAGIGSSPATSSYSPAVEIPLVINCQPLPQSRSDQRSSLLSLGLGLQRSKGTQCSICDLWQRLTGEQTRVLCPPIRTVKLCGVP